MTTPNLYSLCGQFACLGSPEEPNITARDTTVRTFSIQTEKHDREYLTIELSQRGGFDTPNMLRLYCSAAQAFVITFSLNSRESFDSLGIFADAIANVSRKEVPIALVGMQTRHKLLMVTSEEASKRAAELGAQYFPVQARISKQVMAPFEYLVHRHIQGRTRDIGLSGRLFPQKRVASLSWLWHYLAACLGRREGRSDVWFD